MSSALRRTGLICLTLASCDPADDIVARPAEERDSSVASDSGTPPTPTNDTDSAAVEDAGSSPAADAGIGPPCCDAGLGSDQPAAGAGPPACTAGSDTLLLVTKEPRLYRVYPEAGKQDPRGALDCLPAGEIAAAVDANGKLWTVPEDGVARVIDPDSRDCAQIALKARPTAMAFVYYPELGQDLLYVLEAGELIAFDPRTLARRPIGKLAHSRLAGTADGRLFALSDGSGGAITWQKVDTADASLAEGWKTGVPSGLALTGAVMHAGSLSLIFGADLYRAALGADSPQFVSTLLDPNPGIAAVAAAPCAEPPK